MKKFRNSITAALAVGLAVMFTLSACQKSFNAKSYAPSKPAPTFGGYSASSQIEKSSLVAYWPFSGSLKDSLSSTTGTATSATFGTGVEGQGLNIASAGYVETNTPAAVKALTSFTISVWVKMPLNTGAAGLVSVSNSQNFWGNLDIFFDNGGTATTGVLKVHVFNNGGSNSGSDAWEGGYTVTNPWNVWTQVVVTYDNSSSTVDVYYDGASVGTNTVATFAPLDWSQTGPMVFGQLQFQTNPSLTSASGANSWAAGINGLLDQVRVYNTPLTATEVSALYNLEKLGR